MLAVANLSRSLAASSGLFGPLLDPEDKCDNSSESLAPSELIFN
jgi:hypothetical protein